MEHVGIIADLNTLLNAFNYADAESSLKSYRLEAFECVYNHFGSQRGVAAPLVQKKCYFLPCATTSAAPLVSVSHSTKRSNTIDDLSAPINVRHIIGTRAAKLRV
ncbi:unnamed protein product [Pleuronectes platessa]|uniref:Uncharacterized protein n=1 Tax=Pleuronectes platessa TaxID=8262 RepID=A0A9N7VMN5_PLEPL|nr:unnamed protein product [Pleuronectes platessa]